MQGQQLNVFEVHRYENVPAMQVHLDSKRGYFSKKCGELFDLLMNGKELTVLEAHAAYGITSLPRRIKDLKENGVLINDRWDGSVKVWYMTADNKELNQKFKTKAL